MAIYCIHCGTELPDIAQFCLTCGKPPRREAAAATATQVSAPPDTYPAYLNAPTARSDSPSAPDPFTPPPPPLSSYYATESPYAPGSAGAPSPAQRKSRRGLWIALAVIAVVLVAGGGGAAYYFANQSTPTKTLQATCDALKSQNYQAVYNLFTTDWQHHIGPEGQYAADVQRSNSSQGGIVSCMVSGVTEQGSSASGTVVIRFGNGNTEVDFVQLVDENWTWKISGAR